MRAFYTQSMTAPERIGKYRLDRLLASGGMGEVFLAHHDGPAGFSKTLVVKRILQHLAADEQSVNMFLNEARLAALLSHPNVVQIFELGHEDDAYFLAMEYIHGKSLRHILKALAAQKCRLTPAVAAHLCAQALRGLHYAHGLTDTKGQPLRIVHRDVTPENILIGFEGAVKLVDFGIAKAMTSDATQVTTVLGKRKYMAPEQLSGQAVDARADVYGMGVVLYEVMTAEAPHARVPPSELMHKIVEGPVPPHTFCAEVPERLSDIVMRALRANAAERFQSAGDMANALETYLAATAEIITQGQVTNFMQQLFPLEVNMHAPAPVVIAQGTRPLQGSAEALTRIDSAQQPALEPLAVGTGMKMSSWPRRAWLMAAVGVLSGLFWWANLRGNEPDASPKEASSAPQPIPSAISIEWPKAEPAPPVQPQSMQPATVLPKAHVPKRVPTGTVTVRVHPWAEVLLDDKSLGTTPFPPVEVAAGRHTFLLRNVDLNVEKKVTIVVPKGGEASVTANLMQR